MADDKPPLPRASPKPFPNGHDTEPITGVFAPRTGRTRRMAVTGAVIAAVVTLLTPIVNAIAARIAPPPPQQAFVDPALIEELRAIRDAHQRDGGGR